MAFTKLFFRKPSTSATPTSWASQTDFPTFEYDEEKVRSDLQLFHDETRDALNAVIDKLEATTDGDSGADNVKATPVSGGTANTIQGILDEFDERIIGVEGTLDKDDWSSNSQTITIEGVTADNLVIVSPAPGHIAGYSNAGIYCVSQGTDSLTFNCSQVPEADIIVSVIVLKYAEVE